MRNRSRLLLVLVLSMGWIANAAEMTPGRGEVAGFAGGVHVTKGGGNHTALGGAVGAAVHKSVFVFGEFTYVPIGVEGFFDLPGTVRSDASARLVDFSGGVHLMIPTSNEKVVPYVLGTLGVGRSSASGSVTSTVVTPGRTSTTTFSFDESSSDFGLGAGGGLRLYVTDNWGIRPEFKVGRYFVEGGGVTALRFTVGVFYQFGGR